MLAAVAYILLSELALQHEPYYCLAQEWERYFQSLKPILLNLCSVAASGKWLQNTASLEYCTLATGVFHNTLKLLVLPAIVVAGNELCLGWVADSSMADKSDKAFKFSKPVLATAESEITNENKAMVKNSLCSLYCTFTLAFMINVTWHGGVAGVAEDSSAAGEEVSETV